jgi:transcriptional regulator with XRE-family HTH domain
MQDTLGKRIREAREREGISQGVLSERTGLHRVVLSRLECGTSANPRLSTLRALADALNVSISFLAGD